METTGLKLTDLLWHIYDNPIKVQSDYARAHASYIAMAASLGYITSEIKGHFTREWRITSDGLLHLDGLDG